MDNAIIKSADTREFQTRERCHIRELVNDDEAPEFSLAQTRVEPGVTTELHKLSVDECYVMLTNVMSCAVVMGEWKSTANPGLLSKAEILS